MDEAGRLLLRLALASALDVISTLYGLEHGQTEDNPAMAALLAAGGPLAFTLAKLAVILVAMVMVRRLGLRWPVLRLAVRLGALFTILVAAGNLYVLAPALVEELR